jgi:hypothetical protein
MTEQQPSGRQRLEQAVTKVGKAFDELVRTVEKHGAAITREDLDKVFAFLGEVHQGSHNKAALSLSTAIAATGAFSLDKYVPSALTLPVAPALAGAQREGRMVGTKPRKKREPLEQSGASEFLDDEE